jgi:hypothetical protein
MMSWLVAVFVATTATRARAAAVAAAGVACVLLVETRILQAARAASAFAELAREAVPTAAAAAAVCETGKVIAARVTVRVTGRSVATGRGSRIPCASSCHRRQRPAAEGAAS